MKKKRLVLLGSTGSIGCQALQVVDQNPDRLEVVGLAAHRSVDLLREQAWRYRPLVVALGDDSVASSKDFPCPVLRGSEGINQLAVLAEADMVLVSLLGASGLRPTWLAIHAGKEIALANKETLVAGGDLIMQAAREQGVPILPVDSEHSAIFQCLQGETQSPISSLILTASGGPFANFTQEQLEQVTVEQALNHPTWRMGNKITIDSATLMNKGLETLEAHWLFGVPVDKIEVVIHPQSIIHSLVEFVDGSMKAQLGLPDMRLPIQYALLYPERVVSMQKRLELVEVGKLTFAASDPERFPCLRLAREAACMGGTQPAVMNAANEIAVHAFLQGQLPFTRIPTIIEQVMEQQSTHAATELADIFDADRRAREKAQSLISCP